MKKLLVLALVLVGIVLIIVMTQRVPMSMTNLGTFPHAQPTGKDSPYAYIGYELAKPGEFMGDPFRGLSLDSEAPTITRLEDGYIMDLSGSYLSWTWDNHECKILSFNMEHEPLSPTFDAETQVKEISCSVQTQGTKIEATLENGDKIYAFLPDEYLLEGWQPQTMEITLHTPDVFDGGKASSEGMSFTTKDLRIREIAPKTYQVLNNDNVTDYWIDVIFEIQDGQCILRRAQWGLMYNPDLDNQSIPATCTQTGVNWQIKADLPTELLELSVNS